MKTQTIPVYETSHEDLAEQGYEVGDNGAGERALYASLRRRNLLSRLTPTQYRVIICFDEDGMNRRKASRRLMVSLQAIHQIVARIKERFPEEDERRVRNLAWFFWMIYPGTNDRIIRRYWYSHPVLKDYPRPDEKTLATWFKRYGEALSRSRSKSAASDEESAPRMERREGEL